MSTKIINETEAVINRSYETAVQSVNTGFALATALAYMELVKEVINRQMDLKKNGLQGYVMYALAVTIMSAIVFTITDRHAKSQVEKSQLASMLRGN